MIEPLFYQLFERETSTYTYLLADPSTREAVIIDPVRETFDRDLELIEQMQLKLRFVFETHIHADHVTGAAQLRAHTGAKIAVSRAANAQGADLELTDGQEIKCGDFYLRVISTPGHTDSCMSYLCGDKVFTGDALLIRGTGRTDFQQGSSDRLYDSVTKKLFSLPPETKVYPAHDYHGLPFSTIALEKEFNPRLGGGKSKAEFAAIMGELKLDPNVGRTRIPAVFRPISSWVRPRGERFFIPRSSMACVKFRPRIYAITWAKTLKSLMCADPMNSPVSLAMCRGRSL